MKRLVNRENAFLVFEEGEELMSGLTEFANEYGDFLYPLWHDSSNKLSNALMETISIIAYKQPVTRGDIEEIRGVSASTQIMRSLLDRDWIKAVGYRDVPGRPVLYETTKTFLNDLNLKSINDLPVLPEALQVEATLDQLEVG